MLKINDSVMHRTSGVCRVKAIREDDLGAGRQQYYVLEPTYDKGMTIYIPTSKEHDQLRRLLTAREIKSLIENVSGQENVWISDDRKRRQYYRDVLKSDDPQKLICLISTLYQKKNEREKEGKKFYAEDQGIMEEAEKILHGEIAFVMDIEPDEVVSYIGSVLGGEKAKA
ncbi:MAG: CarD family transcriptional regulator [Lachnospiraceae bacterium]|jgi:CarD family transcriptional regulator|nr:CarD family transcriptional regulator [Lachnospiraceae bacterium]MCI1727564.1 CarD family transcriptional regulator [Lachnospiraceae bacterium]